MYSQMKSEAPKPQSKLFKYSQTNNLWGLHFLNFYHYFKNNVWWYQVKKVWKSHSSSNYRQKRKKNVGVGLTGVSHFVCEYGPETFSPVNTIGSLNVQKHYALLAALLYDITLITWPRKANPWSGEKTPDTPNTILLLTETWTLVFCWEKE